MQLPLFKTPDHRSVRDAMNHLAGVFAARHNETGELGFTSAPLEIGGIEYRVIVQTNEAYLADLRKMMELEGYTP